jgi:hypothetical protein
MLTGDSLVATPVVTRQPGHQVLGVAELHLDEEVEGGPTTEDGRPPPEVGDDHVLATLLVRETLRSATHRRSLARLPWEAMCTL